MCLNMGGPVSEMVFKLVNMGVLISLNKKNSIKRLSFGFQNIEHMCFKLVNMCVWTREYSDCLNMCVWTWEYSDCLNMGVWTWEYVKHSCNFNVCIKRVVNLVCLWFNCFCACLFQIDEDDDIIEDREVDEQKYTWR